MNVGFLARVGLAPVLETGTVAAAVLDESGFLVLGLKAEGGPDVAIAIAVGTRVGQAVSGRWAVAPPLGVAVVHWLGDLAARGPGGGEVKG